MLVSLTFGNLKKLIRQKIGETIVAFGEFINIRADGNNMTGVRMITPYGYGSYPVSGQGLLTPLNGSNKYYACLGFLAGLPESIDYEIKDGESWVYSKNYILVVQNDAVRAYRNDDTFSATLPNGESFVQMMLNRINEMEQTISTINANYDELVSKFNDHTHIVTGVESGSSTATSDATTNTLSQTQVTVYPTLGKDKTYLSNGEALINDEGKIYE